MWPFGSTGCVLFRHALILFLQPPPFLRPLNLLGFFTSRLDTVTLAKPGLGKGLLRYALAEFVYLLAEAVDFVHKVVNSLLAALRAVHIECLFFQR